MKKILFIVLIFITRISFAQDVSFGAIVGLNSSKISIKQETNTVNYKARIGILMGAYLRYTVSDRFSVQPELHYAGYGGKNTVLGKSYTSKLNYLCLPVFAKINFTDQLFALTGPQFSYALSKRDQDNNKVTGLKNYVIFWGFGMGYDFGLFDVSARYNLGLTDISKITVGDEGTINVFQLVVSYKLVGDN